MLLVAQSVNQHSYHCKRVGRCDGGSYASFSIDPRRNHGNGRYLVARTHVVLISARSFTSSWRCGRSDTSTGRVCCTGSNRYQARACLFHDEPNRLYVLALGASLGCCDFPPDDARFKALLFLSAGSVILACHHEQNIFKMGGLRANSIYLRCDVDWRKRTGSIAIVYCWFLQ